MTSIFDTFNFAQKPSAPKYRFPQKSAAIDFIVEYLQTAGVTDSPQSYAVWAHCRSSPA